MPLALDTIKQTDITVVLCTFNRQKMLRAALDSLINLRSGPGFGYEILVVDDGSTDQTLAVVQSMMNASAVEVRYIRQENKGVAAARNAGVRNSRGQWIAFFDDDQLADQDWLAHLVAAAKSNDADCVGGPCLLKLPDSGITLSRTIRCLLGENPMMREQLPLKGRRIDPRNRLNTVAGTGNALVRKKLFDRIGLFSEVQGYGEDLHFFRRAQESGAHFAIAPLAIVHHVIPANRLTPGYLLAVAGKGGASQGQIDIEVRGTAHALWNAAMRSAHLMFWTLPGLFAFWLLCDTGRILSKRCSARFASEYLAAVARPTWRQLAGRAC